MPRRRKRKKSPKCPEPFNSMIGLAGGLAMGAVASKMEKKNNYSKNGKINPYAASAMGIGMGGLRTTEDLIRAGAMMGAMGAFDGDSKKANDRVTGEFDDDDMHVFVYCKVRFSDSGAMDYYRTEDHTLRKGDRVVIPARTGKGTEAAEIISVEHHMSFSVPKPLEQTQFIISRETP